MSLKRVCVLGSTGSIGTQTLEVIQDLNQQGQCFEVVALAAGENLSTLSQQIREFQPQWICLKRESDWEMLQQQLGPLAQQMKFTAGEAGLKILAAQAGADLVVNGLVGAVGLIPTLAALEAGVDVALANKESLVIGGHLVKAVLEKSGAQLLPIDSEHNAIFQLLEDRSPDEISKIVLTASGGALRDWPLDQLQRVTPEDVLAHPTWQMGKRITVDSATLVNKAFEVIEAHWLFDLAFEQIEVVIHPQSLVHGMVEFCDGGVIAHLSVPDMRGPIQHALMYPDRPSQPFDKLHWKCLRLEFSPLDEKRYPAFQMVVEAGRSGGTYPVVANAADEVAVERFLRREIPFTQIVALLEKTLAAHEAVEHPNLEEILEADRWARQQARRWSTNPMI